MSASPGSRHWSRRVCLLFTLLSLLALPTPAAAESECVTDAVGDVTDMASETATDVPAADIVASCIELTPDTIEISVRVVAATDPTDPAWDDFSSAIGAAIDVDGVEGEEFDVNFARFDGGEATVRVYPHAQSEVLCEVDGSFDGTRYRLIVPSSCIGSPSQVSVAPFLYYGSSVATQDQSGYYDEIAPFPSFTGPVSTAADPATAVQRLAAPSRVDTAVAISRDDFADGSAQSVVLARAENFPDALVAAPLATATGGPLLLTSSSAVAQAVSAEIQRVLPAGGTVYLSGGTAALDANVEAQIESLGYNAVRAQGPNRYATALAVARAANADPGLIVVANGNDFPDALIGGSLAASEGGVEILTNGAELSADAAAYLSENPNAEVLAIGSVAAQAVPGVPAIAGADAFATSVAVAQQRYGAADGFAIASGTNFPDALAGGAHAGRRGIPLLLSWPDVLPDSVAGYLSATGSLNTAYAYGGTAALSYGVESGAAAALN